MSTMKDVKAALTPGCFMAKLDLKDCFWGVPIAEEDQRATAFRWRGINYVFRCLPFGLALSPMYITKLYRHVVEYLQERGHRVIIYIDDLLILGDSAEECTASVQAAMDLLKELGAVVNEEKSSLCPAQTIEYLGFCIDSLMMSITAPHRKIVNLKKAVRALLRHPDVSARELASILGKINSMADALFPVRVHTTHLHSLKLSVLSLCKGWDHRTQLTDGAIDDLRWWLDNIVLLNGRSILPPKVDLQAATDASDFAWGAWLRKPNGLLKSWGGMFSREEAQKHINYKELSAILYFLTSCLGDIKGKTVDLGVDNTTALHYVHHMGGRRTDLALLAQKIFHVTQVNHIKLLSHHIPGELNHLADRESRKFTTIQLSDCQLDPCLFDLVDSDPLFGPHRTRWTRLRRFRTNRSPGSPRGILSREQFGSTLWITRGRGKIFG